MQDTFARATNSVGQARRATIGYLVYKQKTFARARTRPKGARPSARATIGYLVYNICDISNLKSACKYIGIAYFHTPIAHPQNKTYNEVHKTVLYIIHNISYCRARGLVVC